MGNKLFFTLLSLFGIGFFGWYTLVFSNFYKNTDISFYDVSSKKIYSNSSILQKVKVYFHAPFDISSYKISSPCHGSSKFVSEENGVYVFEYTLQDSSCHNNNFYLASAENIILSNTHFELAIQSEYEVYNRYLDFDSESLKKALKKIETLQKKYTLFQKVKENATNSEFAKKSFYYQELEYNKRIIQTILASRLSKYSVPVPGYELPSKNLNKLPNGGRPYRAGYTDGIHEGWDIDAPFGTQVASLDAGIIVKVVRDFQFSDLHKLKTSGNLTHEERVKNLDILRGNQVWLKTMKGDVVFYSHLSTVYEDIQEGNMVPKNYPLGKVGKTGVPDKDYEDYHLHFEVRKNPYIVSQAGKYSWYDYMNWDWYFKGQTREYIREHQDEIFE